MVCKSYKALFERSASKFYQARTQPKNSIDHLRPQIKARVSLPREKDGNEVTVEKKRSIETA